MHRQFAVLNLANHDFSSFLRSDVDLLSDHVRRGFKELTEAVKALKGSLERTLGPLTANSGIAFSVDTIAEIRGIMQGNIHNAKRNASGLSPEGIQEIVRCDLDSAYALFRYLTMMGLQAESLDDVDGIEPDLREFMRKALYSLDKKL